MWWNIRSHNRLTKDSQRRNGNQESEFSIKWRWMSKDKYRKFDCRDGCTTSEDIYWKLDALMNFVIDLNWPEEEFRRYLTGRMKNLTSEMITKVANWSVISRMIDFKIIRSVHSKPSINGCKDRERALTTFFPSKFVLWSTSSSHRKLVHFDWRWMLERYCSCVWSIDNWLYL